MVNQISSQVGPDLIQVGLYPPKLWACLDSGGPVSIQVSLSRLGWASIDSEGWSDLVHMGLSTLKWTCLD